MSLEQEALAGEVASRILTDETIKGLFNEIKQALLDEIASTDTDQSRLREEIYFELKGIDALLTRLKGVADSGIYARSRLNRS